MSAIFLFYIKMIFDRHQVIPSQKTEVQLKSQVTGVKVKVKLQFMILLYWYKVLRFMTTVL